MNKRIFYYLVDGKPPGDWRQPVVWCLGTSYDGI